MRVLLLLALPMLAQEFEANFDKLLFDVNRSRYDKALEQLFPVQRAILENTQGKPARMDEGMRQRMGQMRDPTAVLSTLALLRSHMAAGRFEEAQVQALLLGMGLSGLWANMPAYQKLDFAKEDVAASPPGRRNMELPRI